MPSNLLEEDHPARIIDIVVENLDLTELYDEYSDEGCPGFHPKMLLKVLFSSYRNGLMSCRKMWDNLKYRADYIYLSGDQIPDFRTINRFRLRVKNQLPRLFTQIVVLCVELGLVDFQYLAIDGQKIQANASYRMSKNKERYTKTVKRVREGIEKLLSKELNEDFTGQHRNKALMALRKREQKLAAFKEIIADMDESGNINLTDSEAKVMSHKDGKKSPAIIIKARLTGNMVLLLPFPQQQTKMIMVTIFYPWLIRQNQIQDRNADET